MQIRSQALIALSLLLSFSTISAGHTDPSPSSDEATIRAELQFEDNAANNGDADGALKYETSDHKSYNMKGKIESTSRSQEVSLLKFMFQYVKSSDLHTTIVNIKITGSTAIVVAQTDGTSTASRGGKTFILSGTMQDREFWIKSKSGEWYEKRSKDISTDQHVTLAPDNSAVQ